jgi:hypothetical protein
MDVNKALATQIENIQKKTGKNLAQLNAIRKQSGLTKHGELRDMFKADLGLGHGDANTLVHVLLKSDGASAAAGKCNADVLDEIYTGPKAALRPIHDKLMKAINGFGEFETAPKKGYVSLRRKKQFAMLGPATNTRFELGINIKELPADPRITAMPPASMCQYKVKLTDAGEVDAEIIGWVRKAFDNAG